MVEDVDNRASTDDVQTELDHLLRVEPSPEFVARIRTHIAGGPAISAPLVRSLGLSWLPVSTVVAVAMLAVAYSSLSTRNSEPEPVEDLLVRDDMRLSEIAPFPVVEWASPVLSRITAMDVDREPVREEQVLVSDNDAAGIRLLRAAIDEGLIDAGDLPTPAPMELSALEPIAIDALVPAVGLQEERQQ